MDEVSYFWLACERFAQRRLFVLGGGEHPQVRSAAEAFAKAGLL